MFIRFDVIHERDRRTEAQTDGRTDRQTLHDSKDRAYASHRAVKIVVFTYPRLHFLFAVETPLRLSRSMLHGWKENSMFTNCFAACAHLSITVSEIQRDICEKSSLYNTPLHSTLPLGGFLSEYRHPLLDGKN